MPFLIPKKHRIFEFFLMFYLLELTGNLYFKQNIQLFTLLSAFFSIPFLFTHKSFLLNTRFLIIVIFILGYELMHSYVYNLDYSKTFFKVLLLLLFGYSTFLFLGHRFILVFVKTMVLISIVSFIFTSLCIHPPIYNVLFHYGGILFPLDLNPYGGTNSTLIIYSFDTSFISIGSIFPRNPGIFWEAGAFGTFLNISLFLYYISKKPQTYKGFFDKTALILIIAILTTMSTTSYLVFAGIILLFSMQLKFSYKLLIVPILIFTLSIGITSLTFLQDKILSQIAQAKTTQNRFGAALLDWEDIKEKPFIGWSRRTSVLFGDDVFAAHRPNGITNLLRSYGLIYFCVYFIFVYKSWLVIVTSNYYKKLYAIFGVFMLLALAFSQILFTLPLFMAIPFLSITVKRKNILQ